MNWTHILIGRVEARLLAVGAYSFAAFSVAVLVQIMVSGRPLQPIEVPLARLALTSAPLLVTGMCLDFYCVGRPRRQLLTALLAALVMGLIGVCASSLSEVVSVFSPLAGRYVVYGTWGALFILAATQGASWLLDRREAQSTSTSTSTSDVAGP